MVSLVERVEAFIERHQLLATEERAVVGLSGGVDSMVLAFVLLRLGYPVTAVHVNYRLRAEDADKDEAFVRSWCAERDVDLKVHAFPTERLAKEEGLSIQHAARRLRYRAFADVAESVAAAKIAVAHHLDDQAETVLLHLFRGTGIDGLAGMPPRRRLDAASRTPLLIRPLLELSRREIESFARENRLQWREDLTNPKTVYRRGAVRSEILPVIERHFGGNVSVRIARSATLMRAYLDAVLTEEIEEAFESAAETTDGMGALRLEALETMAPVMRRRIAIEAMRRWLPDVEATATTAQEIDALRKSQVGRKLEFASGAVWRERGRLLFAPSMPDAGDPGAVLLGVADAAALRHGSLRADLLDRPPERLTGRPTTEAYLDARFVRFPLRVRPWEDGDRFRPFGMTADKKLSDFLTDQRVPPHRKRAVYVVLSDDEIVWVAGHRIAHRPRVRADTTATIRLTYHPAENHFETESVHEA